MAKKVYEYIFKAWKTNNYLKAENFQWILVPP